MDVTTCYHHDLHFQLFAVIRHHMIKNYRCDVKKALSKEDMNNARSSRGGFGKLTIIAFFSELEVFYIA